MDDDDGDDDKTAVDDSLDMPLLDPSDLNPLSSHASTALTADIHHPHVSKHGTKLKLKLSKSASSLSESAPPYYATSASASSAAAASLSFSHHPASLLPLLSKSTNTLDGEDLKALAKDLHALQRESKHRALLIETELRKLYDTTGDGTSGGIEGEEYYQNAIKWLHGIDVSDDVLGADEAAGGGGVVEQRRKKHGKKGDDDDETDGTKRRNKKKKSSQSAATADGDDDDEEVDSDDESKPKKAMTAKEKQTALKELWETVDGWMAFPTIEQCDSVREVEWRGVDIGPASGYWLKESKEREWREERDREREREREKEKERERDKQRKKEKKKEKQRKEKERERACFDINTQVLIRLDWPGKPVVAWMDAAHVMDLWGQPHTRAVIQIASLRSDPAGEAIERKKLEKRGDDNAAGRVTGSLDRLVYAPLTGVVEPFVYNDKPKYAGRHPVRIRAHTSQHDTVDLLVTPDHNMWVAPQRERQVRDGGAKSRVQTTYPYQTVEAAKLLTVNPLPASVEWEQNPAVNRLEQQFVGWCIKQSAPIDTVHDYSFTLPSMAEMIQVAKDNDIDLAAHVPAKHLRDAGAYPAYTFTGEDMDAFLGLFGFHTGNGSLSVLRTGCGSRHCSLHRCREQQRDFTEGVWDRLSRIKRPDGSPLFSDHWRLCSFSGATSPASHTRSLSHSRRTSFSIDLSDNSDSLIFTPRSRSTSAVSTDITADAVVAATTMEEEAVTLDEVDLPLTSDNDDEMSDLASSVSDDDSDMLYHWTVPQLVVWLLLVELQTSKQLVRVSLPSWVWLLTSRQVAILIDGMAHGDGSHTEKAAREDTCDWCGITHRDRLDISTASKGFADELHALAMHAGMRSTVRRYHAGHPTSNHTGKPVPDRYEVSIHQCCNPSAFTDSRIDRSIGRNGYIQIDDRPETRQRQFWCVTTAAPSHVVLVRRRVDDFDDKLHHMLARPQQAYDGYVQGEQWVTAWLGNCTDKYKHKDAKKLQEANRLSLFFIDDPKTRRSVIETDRTLAGINGANNGSSSGSGAASGGLVSRVMGIFVEQVGKVLPYINPAVKGKAGGSSSKKQKKDNKQQRSSITPPQFTLEERLRMELKSVGLLSGADVDLAADYSHRADDEVCAALRNQSTSLSQAVASNNTVRRMLHPLSLRLVDHTQRLQLLYEAEAGLHKSYKKKKLSDNKCKEVVEQFVQQQQRLGSRRRITGFIPHPQDMKGVPRVIANSVLSHPTYRDVLMSDELPPLQSTSGGTGHYYSGRYGKGSAGTGLLPPSTIPSLLSHLSSAGYSPGGSHGYFTSSPLPSFSSHNSPLHLSPSGSPVRPADVGEDGAVSTNGPGTPQPLELYSPNISIGQLPNLAQDANGDSGFGF